MINVLLLKGGGSSEHEIALRSAQYIESQIDKSQYRVYSVEIDKSFNWIYEGRECELNFQKELVTGTNKVLMDIGIPCLHGYPGETGDIQSYFELIGLPYLGCNPETSTLCFNKLMTKLALENAGVKTTPFLHVSEHEKIDRAQSFFNEHGCVFIKATNQGSSVGCYRVDNKNDLEKYIKKAFEFSPFVILEKEIKAREIEVSAFEYDGKVHITLPGEIVCPGKFYSYEEKYSDKSETKTHVIAPEVSTEIFTEVERQARIAFELFKLRHLSRIDFFLTETNEVIINEINTFPGHTTISMFPMMMENYGVKYSDFLNQHLNNLSKK